MEVFKKKMQITLFGQRYPVYLSQFNYIPLAVLETCISADYYVRTSVIPRSRDLIYRKPKKNV